MTPEERSEQILSAIYDDVDFRLNPSGDCCPECGDEGYVYDCHDEIGCVDPESGCEECARRCRSCLEYKHDRLRAIREEVIDLGDVDVAIAWLRTTGRWRDTITREQVMNELMNAQIALAWPTSDVLAKNSGGPNV